MIAEVRVGSERRVGHVLYTNHYDNEQLPGVPRRRVWQGQVCPTVYPVATATEAVETYTVQSLLAENWGRPYLINITEYPGLTVMDQPRWRMYSLLRARGQGARQAWYTVRRRDPRALLIALLLTERHGHDRAMLLVRGALDAPFGAQRIVEALDLPPGAADWLFPRRALGPGYSASGVARILRAVEAALPYVY